jgi:hypothetical protein
MLRHPILLPSLLIALASGGLVASERNFTYTHESAVLAPGEKELELWSTYRRGREDFYSRMDNRLELEVGVADRLMSAFYLNYSSITQSDGAGGQVTEAEFTGASVELKYKLSDPVADAIGSALYGEVSLGSEEGEIELKFIADKRIDRLLFAANVVYEAEFEFEAEDTETEHILEGDIGATYFIQPRFSLGLETRAHQVMTEHDGNQGALFVGPVAAFHGEHLWFALTALWQVAALSGENADHGLELDDHERVNVRLLVGTHF